MSDKVDIRGEDGDLVASRDEILDGKSSRSPSLLRMKPGTYLF